MKRFGLILQSVVLCFCIFGLYSCAGTATGTNETESVSRVNPGTPGDISSEASTTGNPADTSPEVSTIGNPDGSSSEFSITGNPRCTFPNANPRDVSSAITLDSHDESFWTKYYIFPWVTAGDDYFLPLEPWKPPLENMKKQIGNRTFTLSSAIYSYSNRCLGLDSYILVDETGKNAGVIEYRRDGTFSSFTPYSFSYEWEWPKNILPAYPKDPSEFTEEDYLILAEAYCKMIIPADELKHFSDGDVDISISKSHCDIMVGHRMPDGVWWDWMYISFATNGRMSGISVNYFVHHPKNIPDYDKADIAYFCEQFFLKQKELGLDVNHEAGRPLEVSQVREIDDSGVYEFGVIGGNKLYFVLLQPEYPGNPVHVDNPTATVFSYPLQFPSQPIVPING